MNNRLPLPDYETFELLIGLHNGRGYPVSVVQSLSGEASTDCYLDPQSDDLIKAVTALSEGITDGSGLYQIGRFLFENLFTGDLATLFRANLSVVRVQRKHLRIKLRIEAPELASLPWEYLYDPFEDSFLATSTETTLVRFLPLRLPARPAKTKLPLRLLLVISNPSDLQPLNVEAEKQIIQEALAVLIKTGQFELYIVEHATLDTVSQALRQFQPHILHLAGHGLFDSATTAVILEDKAKHARVVNERDFRELLAISKELRLAVLNICQSATLSSSQLVAGLAPQLLQRQLAAVVAMQFPIRDQAALIFCRDFYRSLAVGYPVDVAVSEGRRGILLELGSAASDWSVPVLFLRAKDSFLFRLEPPKNSKKDKVAIPPPEPTKPPSLQGFVGRAMELARYTNDLQRHVITVIAGMPGVGKTMLIAKVAEHLGAPAALFWHTFHQGESVLTLIWKIAAFLAWHGKGQLWQMLQANQRSGGQTPPSILVDYLCQQLQNENYVLCLDDFHILQEDDKNPLLEQLIEGISAIVRAGRLKLLIT